VRPQVSVVAGETTSRRDDLTCGAASLRGLDAIRPLYFLPRDPFAEEVLIPAFGVADHVDCMVGFFSSAILAELAPGLATYLERPQHKFRLVISPMLSAEDQRAIEEGVKSLGEVMTEFMEQALITVDLLQQHTLKCLAHLLRRRQIDIQIALMEDALFHPKVWLFRCGDDLLVAHGSSNVTYAGIRKNMEQVAVSKSWADSTQRFTTDKLASEFADLWENRQGDCIVVSMPKAIEEKLIRNYGSEAVPTENDLRDLYKRAKQLMEQPQEPYEPPPRPVFAIPEGLQYMDGPFQHQGQAVKAWVEAGYRGVLEMATGSGKTITAMICAYRLYERQKPLLIVVSAPYVPLIQQWCDEIAPFGLRPINLTETAGARGRAQQLNRIKRRFRNSANDVEVVVVSHRTLCDDSFKAEIAKIDGTLLLVADEAHNLGAEGFTSDPPECFKYRLGLSATPIRQYDEEGTAALLSFFGPIVFRFTLKEAIGRCLVEYDYFVHPVELTVSEMDAWYDLTAQIKANAWRQDHGKPDEYLSKLFRDRRALLETAENKIPTLNKLLEREDLRTFRHTLIYATDKAPEQLDAVNALLKAHGILFHQLTYEETASRTETARVIRSFQEGTLRVLTAKRVLDEGVNIPQIERAFILASTTVERQWIQRRGRLLRTCREIGKTHAEIHDFLALPPDLQNVDGEARTLVRSELLRVQEFASLARNAGSADGPLPIIHKMVDAAFV
jgi:superfamily II DNA or RNA helicase